LNSIVDRNQFYRSLFQLVHNITLDNNNQVTAATNHKSDMLETSSSYVHLSPENSYTLTDPELLADTAQDLCLCSALVMIPICSLLPGLYRRWRASVQTTRQSLSCTHLGETNYTPSLSHTVASLKRSIRKMEGISAAVLIRGQLFANISSELPMNEGPRSIIGSAADRPGSKPEEPLAFILPALDLTLDMTVKVKDTWSQSVQTMDEHRMTHR
jgi:hypothetical protein